MLAGTAARRELLSQISETQKAVRLLKGDLHSAVPPGTLIVLASIARISDCHVKDLAVSCSLDPSTVSRAVAALVKAGLVARAADPADGRARALALTEHGTRTLDEVYGWIDVRLAEALQEWTPEDLARCTALMRRFATDLMSRTTTDSDQPLEAAR
ncbi:MarR family winged helix-turn-helix transcriptional regulator [Actinoplanes sp. NPDC051494]|uniref:MarR family winged helix-turn-helix transcriptional regulator n=1 Tax=Actinoplanes sp. NPDC051494 TaxID=3363907 RepID=UPI003796604E